MAVQGCGLTDSGLEVLIDRATKLVMLQLQSNALTDVCDKFLAQHRLTHLNLQDNPRITLGIVQVLREIRSLQLLSLRQTSVSSKDVARYQLPFKIIADDLPVALPYMYTL